MKKRTAQAAPQQPASVEVMQRAEIDLLGAARKYGQGTRTPTYGRRELRLDRELTAELLAAAKRWVAAVTVVVREGRCCNTTAADGSTTCWLAQGHFGPHEFPPVGGEPMMTLVIIGVAAFTGLAGFAFGVFFERDRHVCRIQRADISEALRRSSR